MVAQLRRPILVGGVGLSFTLWMMESLQHWRHGTHEIALLGIMASSAGLWWWRNQLPNESLPNPSAIPLDQDAVEQVLTQTETLIETVKAEAETANSNAEILAHLLRLKEQTIQLKSQPERETLMIGVTGGKSVGKTALVQVLESNWLNRGEKSFTIREIQGEETDQLNIADLVLFVTSADITASEFKTLSDLVSHRHRVVLVWNKQDQYLIGEQPQILQRLRETTTDFLQSEDVLAIAASPNPVKVRQHQDDGSIQEWMETQHPQVEPLIEHLSKVAMENPQALVWATTYRAAIALQKEAKSVLNQIRRERAIPIVEQYQWIAATAAFANPVPALDVLATAAINAQLVIDLGEIYQQKFSLKQGQEVAMTLGSQMLQLGFVELTTQTLTSVLKTNTITFIAGSAVQGVSAAYLTRIAGLSLMEYFQTQEPNLDANRNTVLNLDFIKTILQNVFQQNQQLTVLQSFIKETLNRFTPQMKQNPVGAKS